MVPDAARALGLVLVGTLLAACGPPPTREASPPAPTAGSGAASVTRVAETTSGDVPLGGGLADWRAKVPQVQELSVASTVDGAAQPALLVAAPAAAGPAPLLVVLHAWSSRYDEELGIPYARFARQQGWSLVQPDFRGANVGPETTGSDLAVQDVLDAVDEAGRRAPVDPGRVYVVGLSGGGHMGLLMAGRHPDRFAGVVAWVPIHDLNTWDAVNRDRYPSFVAQLARSCGGDPHRPGPARQECAARSPSSHLDAAREAGLPVYLAAGLSDPVVPPDQALRAFNQLATSGDVSSADLAEVAGGTLPAGLRGQVGAPTFFGQGDPPVLFARSAGPVTAVLFQGSHEMIYNPGIAWLVDRDERRP